MNELTQPKSIFREKIARVLSDVRCEVARTDEQIEEIYRLRYDACLREGAILPFEPPRLPDKYDELPNGYNFGFYIDDTLLAALRLHVIGKDEPFSPDVDVYPGLLADRLAAGTIMINCTRFAANYPLARQHPQLPYIAMRPLHLAGEYFDASYIVSSVRSEHYAFYKREYFAEKLCEPRPYPMLIKRYGLISIAFRRDHDAILERHPYYHSTAEEKEALFGVRPGLVNPAHKEQSPAVTYPAA